MHAAHLEEESCGARRRRELRRRGTRRILATHLASHLAPLLPLLPLLQVHSMHTRADWELVRKEMRELADPHVHERCARDASRTPTPPPPPPHLPRSSRSSRSSRPLPPSPQATLRCGRPQGSVLSQPKHPQSVLEVQARRVRLPRLEHSRAPHSHIQHTALRSANSLLLAPHRCSPPAPPPLPPPLPRPQISRRRPRQDRYPRRPRHLRARATKVPERGTRYGPRTHRPRAPRRPPPPPRRRRPALLPPPTLPPLASPSPLSPPSTYRARTCRSLRTKRRAARSSATTASTRESYGAG